MAESGFEFLLGSASADFGSRVFGVKELLPIPASRRPECLGLLMRWDERDPWDEPAGRALEAVLVARVYDLAAPQVPDIRSGEAAAKMLRAALQHRSPSADKS